MHHWRLAIGVLTLFTLLTTGESASAAQFGMTDTARVAALPAPALRGPADNTTFQTMSTITLTWDLPASSTQYHLQVVPFNNDGPGINLIRDAASTYTIEPPVLGHGPYVMLPGMTYTWHVRVTDKTSFAPEGDATWGPWSSDFHFSTPPATTTTITPSEPPLGATVPNLTPTLHWADTNSFMFYYEVQLSKDQTFTTDPATATASVYINLVHGGQSTPSNSWTVPSTYPLEPATRYFWRARPRVQGNGTPAGWAQPFFFNTPAGATATPAPTASATPAPATATPAPATATPAPATSTPAPSACSWTGTWNVTTAATYQMRLTQSGTSVTGTYADAVGRIDGTVSGNRFSGRWTEATANGGLALTIVADCNSFAGTWGGGSSSTNGGNISGTRASTTTPPVTACSWTGTWSTDFGTMYLTQRGASVTGTYGAYTYNISGTVSGNQLAGESWGGGLTSGFRFIMAAGCNSFTGRWGEDGGTGGPWNGTRVR